MTLTVDAVLGPEGRIAQRLDQYELRHEQLQMADAVSQAITNQHHLMVEAGTGVGKSFAYLTAALCAIAQKQTESTKSGDQKPRVVISTHTISLQEQLIEKDIPFLNAVLPIEFSAVLVKGRSNYVSLRRLESAVSRSRTLFGETDEEQQLSSIAKWSRQTNDGSLTSLGFRPLPSVWDEVRSEHGNCLGKKCPTHEKCHYFKARRRVWNADVLVVNHALFFSDLALRREGVSILPDYDTVIFDEAHTVEAVAADHLGAKVSSAQFNYLFSKLYNERTQKGLLIHHQQRAAQQKVSQLQMMIDDLFARIEMEYLAHPTVVSRFRKPLKKVPPVVDELAGFANQLQQFAENLEEDAERLEMYNICDRIWGLSNGLKQWWTHQSDLETVYWAEVHGKQRRRIELISAPVDIGPAMNAELFSKVPSVILTSATLAVAGQDFSFIKNRLGLTNGQEQHLGSPYDYQKQCKLILHRSMPDPSAQAKEFATVVVDRIRDSIEQTQGRAFVLFTSYSMLRNTSSALLSWANHNGYELFIQGEGVGRGLLLERFRRAKKGVLLGTESFWQGVDVPGEALQNVIITKLPFSVPDHPLLAARIEQLRQQGHNPFMDYQVPEAVIKFKQGFGRLIRSSADSGQVVVLDPRILTKPYGRLFLQSLPECDQVIV